MDSSVNSSLSRKRTTRPRLRRHRTLRRSKFNIPYEFIPLINEFALDSTQQLELWAYTIALLMIHEGQVEVTGSYEEDGRTWVTVRATTGDEFPMVRPNISIEMEDRLREGAIHIMEENRARKPRVRIQAHSK